jgi:hypothetical protein
VKTLNGGEAFVFPSMENIGKMFDLTCINHQFLRWSTKHPLYRSIHYFGVADGVEITKENAKYVFQECDCPYSDLRVIDKEGDHGA